jgi:hypothetical protein
VACIRVAAVPVPASCSALLAASKRRDRPRIRGIREAAACSVPEVVPVFSVCQPANDDWRPR